MGMCLPPGPQPLVGVPPQPGVLRHTATHNVDIVPYVQILDVPVPQLGDRVVDFLWEIDAPALVEQATAVPKISLDRVPQCSACRRPCRAEQLVEVPTIVSFLLYSSGRLSRSSTFQFLMVVAIEAAGEVIKGYAQDRLQQRLVEQCSLTFQFLMVVVGLVRHAFKVSPRDRVQKRFVELIFRVVEVFTDQLLPPHPRTHLVPWMRLLHGGSALFPEVKKVRCWVRTRGRNWVRTLIHGLYADSVVIEEDELEAELESGSEPEEDAMTRFAAGFRLLRVCMRFLEHQMGRPVWGCAYGNRCTFAHSWAELHPEASAHDHELASCLPEWGCCGGDWAREEGRPVRGGAERASTQAVDAPGTNSDKFQKPEGRIDGASEFSLSSEWWTFLLCSCFVRFSAGPGVAP